MTFFSARSPRHWELAQDPKHLGVRIGVIGIVHTWGQNLMDHPHIHCIVTGGGLSSHDRWVSCRKGFFLPVRVLSKLFRESFWTTSSIVSKTVFWYSMVLSVISRYPATSIFSENNSMKRNGLFTANRPLAVPKVFSSILADIPTGLPSAITASLISRTAKSFSGGGIMPTTTV